MKIAKRGAACPEVACDRDRRSSGARHEGRGGAALRDRRRRGIDGETAERVQARRRKRRPALLSRSRRSGREAVLVTVAGSQERIEATSACSVSIPDVLVQGVSQGRGRRGWCWLPASSTSHATVARNGAKERLFQSAEMCATDSDAALSKASGYLGRSGRGRSWTSAATAVLCQSAARRCGRRGHRRCTARGRACARWRALAGRRPCRQPRCRTRRGTLNCRPRPGRDRPEGQRGARRVRVDGGAEIRLCRMRRRRVGGGRHAGALQADVPSHGGQAGLERGCRGACPGRPP
jgi:hypothetical protein